MPAFLAGRYSDIIWNLDRMPGASRGQCCLDNRNVGQTTLAGDHWPGTIEDALGDMFNLRHIDIDDRQLKIYSLVVMLEMEIAGKFAPPPGIAPDTSACSLDLQPILVAGIMRLKCPLDAGGEFQQHCGTQVARILREPATDERGNPFHRTKEPRDSINGMDTHVNQRSHTPLDRI